ncbi:MaoC family dehydratase N-terminal domain-containing protein [Hazenella sp. IB182357]|uniref:MaoC family dehydratase N-terminal domain-containing protein n=1 Tax=Polycladospora coralii TaxID=2771432 RepID=A0A926N7G3_9BACL|nr:MaoC family dehydratase N-terminal domain-containing protein [Polycladospora coralii]MBD1373331.1 MaoC family dehydratase N-terminal domain-containing protein [Polycladospora coralii]MBS7528944.1 MaoC family dehydratase N-terminal domain-containing protein [Polycladospora coralii]
MLSQFIGMRSDKVMNPIERGAVKKFAEAIGDPHPLYFDEETGKNSIHQCNIAPPTFAITLDYGIIPNLQRIGAGLIHGEQQFHYQRPLHVGEKIQCYQQITDYYEKKGKLGEMGFLVAEKRGLNEDGHFIFAMKQVVILNETIRRGLKS